MAGVVVNNVVKMEWEKSGWLQTSAKKGKSTFIFASKDYDSSIPELGVVTVFFTAETAFLIVTEPGTDDEDVWTAEDFIPVIKKNLGGNFPYDLEEYVPVIASGDDECIADKLERYGLTEYKADIEARLADVAPYGVEEELNLG